MDVASDKAGGWTLCFDGHRYDLRLVDGDLLNVYFGADVAGDVAVAVENRQNRDNLRALRPEAAVFVGPRSDRVRWASAEAEVAGDTFTLRLQGETYPLMLVATFRTDAATGSILRQTTIHHRGDAPIDLRGALSLSALVAGPVTGVTYVSGAWAAEGQVRHIVPDHTPILLESRSGKTGFEYQPYIALDTPGATVVVQLYWSGNWQIHARQRDDGMFVSAGLPDAGFQTELRPGEAFALPSAVMLRVKGDLNAATQKLHDFRRGMQEAGRPLIPVQFNSWYPFPGKPQVDDLLTLLPAARDLGCEVFVLDGGWYDNAAATPQDDPWELTGDWLVHRGMFPNGLQELSTACRAQGINFGIWFEPEGIGYSAALRHEHPEWFHWINGEAPKGRKRGILNFGIEGARVHARDAMLRILRETGATWVKWDFNEDLLRGGWADGTPDDLARQDPLIAHCKGVYLLQEELHTALPDLLIEMCASGGGRFDGEILRRAHTQWMSDQWEPLKNLSIHFGSQLCHPAAQCNDWLIQWPVAADSHAPGKEPDRRGDFLFRIRVAMLGSFGLSARIGNWPAADLAAGQAEIAWYKSTLRPQVQDGDQYILTPAPTLDGMGGWAAIWFAAKDKSAGVALVFRLEADETARDFALQGLDPAAQYTISMPGFADQVQTGAALANGINVTVPGPYQSQRVTVMRVNHD